MTEIERVLKAKEKNKKKKFFSNLNLIFKKFLSKFFFRYYEFNEFKKKEKTFSGWGLLTTGTKPPWKNQNNIDNIFFSECLNNLNDLVEKNFFRLTQFEYEDTNFTKVLNELSWRHYIVSNSITLAIKNSSSDEINIAECGVCDGLTIFFALKMCERAKKSYKGYLYDAWQNLDDKKLRFQYSYLDLEVTKKNLNMFSPNLIYNKGFIPKIFITAKNPTHLDWLHIDLNSNEATQSSLDFFYEKLNKGGIILFDDYGGFDDTRNIIDNFFKEKKGHFINYPTGQGAFIKF